MQEYQHYTRYYNESRFWNKIRKIARRASSQVLFYALLLFYTLIDGNTPIKSKAMIVAALGYLIFPLDALPDFIPLLGLTDDLSALLTVFRNVKKSITPQIELKAKNKTEELISKN